MSDSSKIPTGYQGTYARNANGGHTLVMVSRSDYGDSNKNSVKEQNTMAEQQMSIPETGNGNGNTFVPYTTEQKREYAKQFSPAERKSYRKGQQNAYSHMGNIGRREANYIYGNLQKDNAEQPPAAPATGRKRNSTKK